VEATAEVERLEQSIAGFADRKAPATLAQVNQEDY